MGVLRKFQPFSRTFPLLHAILSVHTFAAPAVDQEPPPWQKNATSTNSLKNFIVTTR
jgi:hypothetical protein